MGVIGPIDADTWYLLRQLRESVKFMKEENPVKFKTAINLETEIYQTELRTAVGKDLPIRALAAA